VALTRTITNNQAGPVETLVYSRQTGSMQQITLLPGESVAVNRLTPFMKNQVKLGVLEETITPSPLEPVPPPSNSELNETVGPTSSRPAQPSVIGSQFFDTTLKRPIWWDGVGWVDANGNPV